MKNLNKTNNTQNTQNSLNISEANINELDFQAFLDAVAQGKINLSDEQTEQLTAVVGQADADVKRKQMREANLEKARKDYQAAQERKARNIAEAEEKRKQALARKKANQAQAEAALAAHNANVATTIAETNANIERIILTEIAEYANGKDIHALNDDVPLFINGDDTFSIDNNPLVLIGNPYYLVSAIAEQDISKSAGLIRDMLNHARNTLVNTSITWQVWVEAAEKHTLLTKPTMKAYSSMYGYSWETAYSIIDDTFVRIINAEYSKRVDWTSAYISMVWKYHMTHALYDFTDDISEIWCNDTVAAVHVMDLGKLYRNVFMAINAFIRDIKF